MAKPKSNLIRHVGITPAMQNELLHQRERTGISTMQLLKGKRDTLPAGLNSAIINQWLAGNIKSAKPAHLEYVLGEWRKLPDKSDAMIEIDDAMVVTIRDKIASTGVSRHWNLFVGRGDLPDGFDLKAIRMVVHPNRLKKYCNKVHYDYVMRVCDEYLAMKAESKL